MKIHVDVTEEDGELACRREAKACMVHRAIVRAIGNLFHPDQVQIDGHEALGYFIHILPYKSVWSNREYINHPHFVEPEVQWQKAREELSQAPYWNRQVNPDGVIIRFGDIKGRSKGLGREDISLAIAFWDNGYYVPPFSFEFEVELRPEWDYHQMDLFDWWEYTGINTGKEILNQVDEALLAERWGGAEELPALALAV